MKYFSLLVLLSFLSCESDPYPEFGSGDVAKKPRRETMPPPAPIGLIVEGKYNFIEGVRRDFQIKASVPAPGIPEIEVEDLPAGASFNPETFTFSWLPGYFDGNDPNDPTIKSRDYSIGIYLRSSLGNIKALYQRVYLTVLDSPQSFKVEGASSFTVIEGRTRVYKFEIINEDFKNGPFSINVENWPGASHPKVIEDNKFEISFSPSHYDVLLNKRNDCRNDYPRGTCTKFTAKIIVYNAANHRVEKDVLIKIVDERLTPPLILPTIEEQGLDTSFQISSYDLNREVAPIIRLQSAIPQYGEFRQELIENKEAHSSVLNIVWNDIPPTFNGKKVKFVIQVCTLGARGTMNDCYSKKIYRKIIVKERKAPVISREEWPSGEIVYLNYSERKNYKVEVNDGDNSSLSISNVEIFPADMRSFVTWKKGKLSVKFSKEGIHQFSLRATSEYNIASAQSFVVEVFAPDRSKTLFFIDSSRTDEVNFYKNIVKDVKLMNPSFQELNKKELSGRNTLIVGSGVLQDASLSTHIEKAMKLIPNILIASPHVRNMPATFLDELTQDHHVSIHGRFNDLSLSHKLTDLHFIARYDFEQSDDFVRLKGTTTLESQNPLLFSVGVDRYDCEDVLDLTDKKEELRLKIGIICDRKYGGRYAILGTEFSDLFITDSDRDSEIPTQWLRRMLSTDLTTGGEE